MDVCYTSYNTVPNLTSPSTLHPSGSIWSSTLDGLLYGSFYSGSGWYIIVGGRELHLMLLVATRLSFRYLATNRLTIQDLR